MDSAYPSTLAASESTSWGQAWPQCPSCHQSLTAAAPRCSSCEKARENFLSKGRETLAQAATTSSTEDSLKWSQEAYDVARELQNQFGEEEPHKQLLQQAATALETKLRELIGQAATQKQLGREMALRQRLLELAPHCLESQLAVRKIIQQRAERLDEAEQLWVTCQRNRALSLLQDLQSAFPQDEDILRRLSNRRSLASLIEQAARVDIPECKRTRAYRRMNEILANLVSLQAPVADLALACERNRKRLQSIEPSLISAKEALANRQFERTSQLCRRILARVSDETEAETLQAEADRAIETLRDQAAEVDAALGSQQWGKAAALLKTLEPGDRQRAPFIHQCQLLHEKSLQSRAYLRVFLFLFAGTGVWFLAGEISPIASHGLGQLLTEVEATGVITPVWSPEAGSFTATILRNLSGTLPLLLHGLATTFLLGFVVAPLAGWKAVKRIPLMWGMLLTCWLMIVVIQVFLAHSGGALDQSLAMPLYGMGSGLAMGLLRRDLGEETSGGIWGPACGGLAGALAFTGGAAVHREVQSGILIEISLAGGLFFALVMTFGLATRITHFRLVPVAIGLGFVLKAGMRGGQLSHWHFLIPGILVPAAMLPILVETATRSQIVALLLSGVGSAWAAEILVDADVSGFEAFVMLCWLGMWILPGLRQPPPENVPLRSSLRLAMLDVAGASVLPSPALRDAGD